MCDSMPPPTHGGPASMGQRAAHLVTQVLSLSK
jgi:hypothetical protein